MLNVRVSVTESMRSGWAKKKKTNFFKKVKKVHAPIIVILTPMSHQAI